MHDPNITDSITTHDASPAQDLITVERMIELRPNESFALIFESPTSPFDVLMRRQSFLPNKLEITTQGADGDLSDVNVFGLYVDRIPAIVGQHPVPIDAFAPTELGQVGCVPLTPFSLVELVGKNHSTGSGHLRVKLQGPKLDLAALKADYASAQQAWFAASHAQAVKLTIAALEAEQGVADAPTPAPDTTPNVVSP